MRSVIWNYPEYVVKFFKSNYIYILRYLAFSVIIVILIYTWRIDIRKGELIREGNRGEYNEAVLGKVSTISPWSLQSTQAEKDVYRLIFQKLFNINNKGEIVPEVGIELIISEDLKEYKVKIGDNNYFSDGTKLTTRDIVFTIERGQDKNLINTFSSEWDSVTYEVIDEYNIVFRLEEPLSSFKESLAFYIIPEHYYSKYYFGSTDFSPLYIFPLGSGPFYLTSVKDGELKFNRSKYYREGHIKKFTYRVYDDIDALEKDIYLNKHDGVVISSILHNSLNFYNQIDRNMEGKFIGKIGNRGTILFFNNRKPNLNNSLFRKAIAYSIDKEGLSKAITLEEIEMYRDSESILADGSEYINPDVSQPKTNIEEATKIIKELGYKMKGEDVIVDKNDNAVELNILYIDTELNKRIAEQLALDISQIIPSITTSGITAEELSKERLPTREFDILIADIQTTFDPDQYNWWHSTQMIYPNLNISGFNYVRTDVIMENARKEKDMKKKKESYLLWQKYFYNELPAFVLYKNNFVYTCKYEDVCSSIDKDINYVEDRLIGISNL